jgi:mannosyltransferase OCH1-like enzyme
MIKKQIHYCWYGRKKKNALIETCIQSWHIYLPDFEIIEWNEDNTVLDCEFAIEAFKHQKWAFLSDYIRLKVLDEYGGLYLDTDMLFIKPLNHLLTYSCFIGYQKNGEVNAAIIWSTSKHPFIQTCLNKYKNMKFDEDRLMSMAIPKIMTEVYNNFYDKHLVKVFKYEVFYPYIFEDSLLGKDYLPSIQNETIAIHMWNASWFTEKELAGFAFEQKKYLKGINLLIAYFTKNPRNITKIPSIIFRYTNNRKK